jgi:anti-sigma regulatory factor (Ser/Thr protein kinase)
LLCEALSNAFYHGHQRDPQRPIGMRVLVGEHGLIVHIADSGPGFDVAAVIDDYFKRRQYYSSAGNGLRLMDQSTRFAVYYNQPGNIFSLLYRFDGAYDSFNLKRPIPYGDAS